MADAIIQFGRTGYEHTCMSAKAATGVGTSINISQYRNAIITIATSDSFSGTIKIQAASRAVEPAWASSASITNTWTLVQCVNLDTGAAIEGSTGIVATGTDIIKQYEVNINGLDWINLNITAIAAGKVNAWIKLYDNE